MRRQEFWAARDNVVFELGLFMGRIGRERSFLVVPRDRKDFHLPSDLAGINFADFEIEGSESLQAALGIACSRIKDTVRRLGTVHDSSRDNQALIKRVVEMMQVEFSEVRREDWKLVYSVRESGNGHLYEEVTLIPASTPIYFCLAEAFYTTNLNGESKIEIAATSLTYGTGLQTIELGRTGERGKYAILLDPPSLPTAPHRIAINWDCTGVWNSLIERADDQGVFRANFHANQIQVEFLAPPGRKWKWFSRSPQIGDVRLESSSSPARITWSISNPPTRRYSYRLSLETE
jgi:hypothetical protein